MFKTPDEMLLWCGGYFCNRLKMFWGSHKSFSIINEKSLRVGWVDSGDIVTGVERKIFMRGFTFCFVSKVSGTKTVRMIKLETRLLWRETLVFCRVFFSAKRLSLPVLFNKLVNRLCRRMLQSTIFNLIEWCVRLQIINKITLVNESERRQCSGR